MMGSYEKRAIRHTGMTMMSMSAGIRGLLAVSATALLAACGSAQADGTEDAETTEAFVRVINVEVAPVQTETFVEEIRLTSVAMANQDVMIEAEESGAIREFYVDAPAMARYPDKFGPIRLREEIQ